MEKTHPQLKIRLQDKIYNTRQSAQGDSLVLQPIYRYNYSFQLHKSEKITQFQHLVDGINRVQFHEV